MVSNNVSRLLQLIQYIFNVLQRVVCKLKDVWKYTGINMSYAFFV
jgi:hypothetical protein